MVLKAIKKDLAYLEKQKDMLAKQKQEYKEVREKIESFDEAEMDRQDKIEWLNLSLKEKRSRELIDQIRLSIETRGKKIAEKNKKAAKIRKKSFLQKLFRR